MFRFIDAENGSFDVAVMCRVLGVSRSGYYASGATPAVPVDGRERCADGGDPSRAR